MQDFRDRYLVEMKGCAVLDIGSRTTKRQSATYRQLFEEYRYTGMDIRPGANVDIVGYENLAPPYDVVISGQVMEHVARPWLWVKQLAGLFGTYICIIAPNKWKQHRHPIDTFRYFPDGMRVLLEDAGIVPLEIRMFGVNTIGIGKH